MTSLTGPSFQTCWTTWPAAAIRWSAWHGADQTPSRSLASSSEPPIRATPIRDRSDPIFRSSRAGTWSTDPILRNLRIKSCVCGSVPPMTSLIGILWPHRLSLLLSPILVLRPYCVAWFLGTRRFIYWFLSLTEPWPSKLTHMSKSKFQMIFNTTIRWRL